MTSCDFNIDVLIEGKCITKNDDNQYGDEKNPSYQDEKNSSVYHYCLEKISGKKYFLNSNSVCQNIKCDGKNGFIQTSTPSICLKCQESCVRCEIEEGDTVCYECQEGYDLSNKNCEQNLCIFYFENNGFQQCASVCPNDIPFYYKSNCGSDCDKFGNLMYHTKYYECKTKCDFEQISLDDERLCLDDCEDDFPEDENNLCTNCASIKLYNGNGTCIVPDETFNEKYVILSGENNTKYGKVDNCYKVDECGDFIISEELINKHPDVCKNKCPTGYENFTNDVGEIVCKKCYKTCENCLHSGEEGNHKCTECKSGYVFSEDYYGIRGTVQDILRFPVMHQRSPFRQTVYQSDR